jgi:mRNA interferase RelE/StbE
MEGLTVNPRPNGCEKLAGDLGYRVRQADYRVIYPIDEESRIVEIIKIGHRREVYR